MEETNALTPPQGTDLIGAIFQGLFGNFFNPDYPMPKAPELKMPSATTEEYALLSEDERRELADDFVRSDPFLSGIINKYFNEDERAKLREMTADIDAQITELNKRREEIVHKWAVGEQ